MKFVIFHGSFGSAEGNWFPQLKENLTALHQEVYVPQFPVDEWNLVEKGKPTKYQNLKNWFKKFEELLPKLKNEKLCFIGYSLGPLFILHIVEKYNLQLDSAIFVSPFLEVEKGNMWQIDQANETFYRKDFDWKTLKKLIPISYAIYSNNDPFIKKELSLEFAEKLSSKIIEVKNAGHFNADSGYLKFPEVFELCKKRITSSAPF